MNLKRTTAAVVILLIAIIGAWLVYREDMSNNKGDFDKVTKDLEKLMKNAIANRAELTGFKPDDLSLDTSEQARLVLTYLVDFSQDNKVIRPDPSKIKFFYIKYIVSPLLRTWKPALASAGYAGITVMWSAAYSNVVS